MRHCWNLLSSLSFLLNQQRMSPFYNYKASESKRRGSFIPQFPTILSAGILNFPLCPSPWNGNIPKASLMEHSPLACFPPRIHEQLFQSHTSKQQQEPGRKTDRTPMAGSSPGPLWWGMKFFVVKSSAVCLFSFSAGKLCTLPSEHTLEGKRNP